MLNIQQILCSNGSAFILLIIVLLSSYRMFSHKPLDSKLINIMIANALIQCLLETITYLIDGKVAPGYHMIPIVLNVMLYIGNTLFAFTSTIYVDYKLFADMNRIKKRWRILIIPAMLIVLLSLMNLFTPIFFCVDKQTFIYQRTDLYFIPNIVVTLYLLYSTMLVYRYRNKVVKYLFLPAIVFLIPILIGAALDYLFYGLAFKQMGIAIALTSVYINVQKEISCIDLLSGLHTRQYMINYYTNKMKRSKSEESLVGILLDVDKFKSINDTYGHLAGDDAIHSVGQILLKTVPKDAMAVRYAGDEFMVIKEYTSEQDVEDLLSSINSATEKYNATQNKPYTISFSAGYSIFNKNKDTLDTFFDRMDSAMYDEKGTK